MGSQVSSITCVALTQQQPLPQMPLQKLLGKSLKHGTSPRSQPRRGTWTATPLDLSTSNQFTRNQPIASLPSSPIGRSPPSGGGLHSDDPANHRPSRPFLTLLLLPLPAPAPSSLCSFCCSCSFCFCLSHLSCSQRKKNTKIPFSSSSSSQRFLFRFFGFFSFFGVFNGQQHVFNSLFYGQASSS